ncbi:MAG: gamma-glutamyltransferase [Candidatus Binatus sp.]|uniref:gamma-glutamyltransferase n=1 Tax=Candidatus Binatus sp. TaxID=2811406 RepID=UPI0027213C72|nr:gamma-glutamyltransferase [Candidatus Binatus sp.]MDO8434983.1 gamma-glutamyltransferase [Candidatus Binatus sp.]
MRSSFAFHLRLAHCRATVLIVFLSAIFWPPAGFAADSQANRAAVGTHGMVVSESDDAAHAGIEILKQGGNAVDAAVATALAVGVTNPASCGIGGGGFMLIYIAKNHGFYALDYRETAPLMARPDMYIRNGKPDPELSKDGILAVAVPGEIAGIDAALRRFGTMKFQQIAAPAEKLAENGFAVNPHLAGEIAHMLPKLNADPGMREVFVKSDGAPAKAGETIYAKKLAATLKRLGDDPVANFYHGEVAAQIVSFMKEHGGLITANDLTNYRPIWRSPIRRQYRGYDVVAMPPPSSGGVVLEMLGMLEGGRLAGLGVDSPPYLARLIEVMRQGFIDRAQYADPAFVGVEIGKLLSDRHIGELRDRALHRKAPPPDTPAAHDHGTTNLLVADKDGNVVALTTTTNTVFGALISVPALGLLLNDEMDDFAIAPGVPNAYHLAGERANEIRPGKRPLSSMTPIIVTKNNVPVMSTGGSGGPTIISGVLQVTLNVLDFHLDAAHAVDEPRIHEQAVPDVVIVEESMPAATRVALEEMGYKIKVAPSLGAVGALTIEPGNYRGAFDQRKGGGAVGY